MAAARLPVVARKNYEVTSEVARGGIGVIYRARSVHLERQVALKELLDPDPDFEERFVAEALLTARLQHPSIVPIYEAGRWPSGKPFYAMKLIAGRSLGDLLEDLRSLDERLALLSHVLAVAEAVAYAHSERIIHRDLKPSNILVGSFGETQVIDWGLAKDLSGSWASPPAAAPHMSQRAQAGNLTVYGTVLGTPAYMPLEQACAEEVDERADVYALGAILYHVLAGTPPYDGPSSLAIVRKVIDRAPVPIRRLQRGIPEDLLAIVDKAMARAAPSRYPTAKELADDLRRFQTGQIVAAHKYSKRERLVRFVRKYRSVVTVVATALALLVLVAAASVQRIRTERDRAEHERERAEHERDRAEHEQAGADQAKRQAVERADALTLMQARAELAKDPNKTLAWLKALSPTYPRWSVARLLAADAISRGISRVLRGHSRALGALLFSPDGRTLITTSDDRTLRLWDVATGSARVFAGHTDEVWGLALSRNGELLASSSKDKTVRLWDIKTGASRVLTGHATGIESVLFSPDGSRLASRDEYGGLWLWDVVTGRGRAILATSNENEAMAISPDGEVIAFFQDRHLILWAIATGQSRRLPELDSSGQKIVYSPDGARIATSDRNGKLQIWSPVTGAVQALPGPDGVIKGLEFSPDSATLYSMGADRTIRAVDLASRRSHVIGRHNEGTNDSMSLSPNGKQLVATGAGRVVMLWDLTTGAGRALYGFEDAGAASVFSPDGRVVAVAARDHTARLWSTDPPWKVVAEHPGGVARAVFFPDGTRVASVGIDGEACISALPGASSATPGWPAPASAASAAGNPPGASESGKARPPRGHASAHESSQRAGETFDVSVSPDGMRVASTARDGSLRLTDVAGGPPLVVRAPGEVRRVAFSPDGRVVATGGTDRAVHLWDARTGEARGAFDTEGAVESLAFSPDGLLLATGGRDSIVRVWTVATGGLQTLKGHEGAVLVVDFSPDGRTLASGSADHSIRIWDVKSGASRSVDAGGLATSKVAFFGGGEGFVSLGRDNSPRVWDARTLTIRRFLRGHSDIVTDIAVSPEGTRAVTASVDRTLRVWDLVSGESRVLGTHGAQVVSVAFSPDGRQILSASEDGTARLWSDDLPLDPAGLRAYLNAATPETVDGTGFEPRRPTD